MSVVSTKNLNFIILKLNFLRFSKETGSRPSYFHRLGKQPLKFLTVGQILKQTALKYPNRLALVSCSENAQITFEETLDKVIKRF